MRRSELEHVIRAAGAIADEDDIVVIGSQAILGAHADAPAPLLISQEADVFPARRPERADVIDGAIGEMSPFHETFGYYAHGVGPETARLPAGWRDRLVAVDNANTKPRRGLCLHPDDLAAAKLLAGREKDFAFVGVMLDTGLADAAVLAERVGAAGAAPEQVEKARGWLAARLT